MRAVMLDQWIVNAIITIGPFCVVSVLSWQDKGTRPIRGCQTWNKVSVRMSVETSKCWKWNFSSGSSEFGGWGCFGACCVMLCCSVLGWMMVWCFVHLTMIGLCYCVGLHCVVYCSESWLPTKHHVRKTDPTPQHTQHNIPYNIN